MSRVYVDGRVFVRRTQCATCIFRPGNLMELAAGRVESMVAGAGDWGCIPCHHHLYQDADVEPVCRGFFTYHRNTVLQIAERLDVITFIDEEAP